MADNKHNKSNIAVYKFIWCKIRYYQQLYDITDNQLASHLGVSTRTLTNYDKNAQNITLGCIDSFLLANKLTILELLDL